jgi:hypothetical protein
MKDEGGRIPNPAKVALSFCDKTIRGIVGFLDVGTQAITFARIVDT